MFSVHINICQSFLLIILLAKWVYRREPPTKMSDSEVTSEKNHLHSWKFYAVAFMQLLTLDKAWKIAHNPKFGPLRRRGLITLIALFIPHIWPCSVFPKSWINNNRKVKTQILPFQKCWRFLGSFLNTLLLLFFFFRSNYWHSFHPLSKILYKKI